MPLKPGRRDPVDRDRRHYMINVYSKRLGPELEELARLESERTGREITKIGLARELLEWAVKHYRAAGSLRRLKGLDVDHIASQFARESARHAKQKAKKPRGAPPTVISTGRSS